MSTQVIDTYAQPGMGSHTELEINIQAELSQLMEELNLTDEQGVVIGLLILKYSLEFDFKEFENASDVKQYSMLKSQLKEVDKDLKEVLDKRQFKIYKKKKKEIRKKLRKGNWHSISVELLNCATV